ncbi:hypothetical protein [Lutimonas zeaxanthinifaciens]|uniref:hypothetical protein n=1 Tax=Lutimonas zeaxanthinifaciens TaxID=3060215 RepID=UPI00265CF707|nr:hypothetical protein [Lutimonas sp. YSD2104]WKK65366.1 hypothetical protein QZH61_12345 [Lutimonas sp. YSD2104]
MISIITRGLRSGSLALFITVFTCAHAQRVVNVEFPSEGTIDLAPGIQIDKINSGYTLWLPKEHPVKGLILFTHARRDTLQSNELIQESIQRNLAVMYATTDNRLEFFFDDARAREINGYLHSVITNYNIPRKNLMYCGMSLEGTRALKLVIHNAKNDVQPNLKPLAVAICDSPLDMVRFHHEMEKAADLNYNPIASNEGKWVSSYLEKNLGGKPKDNFEAYASYSPFCYSLPNAETLNSFNGIAVRAYTEPDVNWWIENRRKDYYGMNSIDLAAFVNALKIHGNDQAELIITTHKGYSNNGDRHPHNWSIVDEKELIHWFSNLLNEK